jgi:N4-gp56 family major capsid protein
MTTFKIAGLTKALPNFDLQHFAGNLNLNVTTTVSTAPATRPSAYYDKVLMTILRQTEFGFDKFAQKKQIPQGNGRTVNYRKLGKLAPALTPLTEGITPDGETASKTNITGTVEQYGSYMSFSDRVDFEEIDPVIEGYSVEQGYQAKETVDIIIREILSAGTNVRYAGGRVSTATITATDVFKIRDARKIVRTFKKNFIKPVTPNGDYIAFISPDTAFDIMDDPDFQKMMDYGGNVKPMMDNEIGRMHRVRYVEVLNAKIMTTKGVGGIDVHASIFIGKDAFGTTEISGQGAVKTIVKGLGSAGTADPLDQRKTIGWKLNAFGAIRLEEPAITRYEHAVTN